MKDTLIRITAAEESDLGAVTALASACRDELPSLLPESAQALFLRNIRRGSVLLASIGGRTAGAVVWSPVLRRISFLAVLPEFRGRGAGSALLESALRRMPPGDVTVETYRDGDPRGEAALALYRKFGFRPERLLTGYEIPMQILKLCRK